MDENKLPVALHLFPVFRLGGAERVVLDLVRLLPERGFRCRLCVFAEDGRFPDRDLIPPDLVELDQRGPITRSFSTVRSVLEMRRMLANEDVDLLHTHLWPADLVGALANIRTGLPHVSHQHGTGKELLRGGVRPTLKRDISRRLMGLSGARFIAVSQAVRAHAGQVYGLRKHRISLIYNGFSERQFPDGWKRRASYEGGLRVGFAGRFDPGKGLQHLIHAFAKLKQTGNKARLRLAGAGPLENEVKQLCSEMGIGDVVEFCGALCDMASFYAGLDAFVLPSFSEGLPMTLIEALAMGCVPVVSDVGGVREVLDDGVEGYIVPPGDENELARALITLAEQPELRARMARAGRKRARTQFTADRMVNSIAALYRTILAESEGCGAHTRRDEGGIAGA